MKFLAYLHDTITNKRAIYEIEHDDIENAWWCWVNGYCACDCNRRLFMMQTKLQDPYFFDIFPCSDGQVVLEKLIVEATGQKVKIT